MGHNFCQGFQAGAIAAGIKKHNALDLGLIYSNHPATVSGVFTRNQIQAAPVMLARRRIQAGLCQAIIVNSGNANCCTGEMGLRDAAAMAAQTAKTLGISEELVLTASTGVIGAPLPIDNITGSIANLAKQLDPNGFDDVARAIMTTDTVPKLISKSISINGESVTITGMAKGAGMIRPDMATLLCFVFTDIDATAKQLKPCLVKAVDDSFNRITIDGDTSTNDTVLILANGMSGVALDTPQSLNAFQTALNDLLVDLAKQIVQDGEGATKLIEIRVKGASSNADARRIADTVAHSNLVKTACFGEDANWGRILAAAGRSGAAIKPDCTDIYFDHVKLVEGGVGCGNRSEQEAHMVLQKPVFSITIDLNICNGHAAMYTCDFSIDYVKINAEYRS